MGRRKSEDSKPLPGKLKNPFDQGNKAGGNGRPLPGKLKNRFGPRQKENLGLNRYPGGKRRGKKGGKDEPTLNNKNKDRKKKGIELFDKDGNKYAGTYKKAEPEGEKYELYDKYGNRLDGMYKKVPGAAKIYDKNGKKLDDN